MKTISITVDIKADRIADLMETAMCHIGYWCKVFQVDIDEDYIEGIELGMSEERCVVYGNGKLIMKHFDPDNGEGLENIVWDQAAVKRGLKLMAEKSPSEFAQFMNEQGDADTGDVFAQYCLLGEVKYG